MSGSLIMREVITNDCALTLASGNTYKFRKGDKIGIFPPLSHYDEDYYPNATKFQYDRFVNPPQSFVKNGQEIPFNMCYLPFGGGVYWCPGRKFARNEIKTLVAYLLVNFEMSFVNPGLAAKAQFDYDGSRAGIGIFPPKAGLDLRLRPKY